MKTALAWVLVLEFGAGFAWQFSHNRQQESQLAALRLQVDTAKTVEAELQESADRLRAADEELKRLREANTELLRLRNQVRLLQTERDGLRNQIQSGQAQLERANNQAQAARSEAEQLKVQTAEQSRLAALQTGETNEAMARFMRRYGLKPESLQTASARCTMNLRRLDAAKSQWALEKGVPDGSTVTMVDLQEYLGGPVTCPDGGVYQLNVVALPVTCSSPGHTVAEK